MTNPVLSSFASQSPPHTPPCIPAFIKSEPISDFDPVVPTLSFEPEQESKEVKLQKFIERKEIMLRNLMTIDQCCEEWSTKMDLAIDLLRELKEQKLSELKRIRNALELVMITAISSIESVFFTQPSSPSDFLSYNTYESYLRGVSPSTSIQFIYTLNFDPLYETLYSLLEIQEYEQTYAHLLNTGADQPSIGQIPTTSSRPHATIPCVYRSSLTFFNCFDKKWGPTTETHISIPSGKESSLAVISPDKVLCCGGKASIGGTKSNLLGCAFIIDRSGAVEQLPNMHKGRSFHGVIYVPFVDSAFVFGGGDASGEQLELRFSSWKSLEKMSGDRSHFNPCLYESLIFLCGGNRVSVDVFSLEKWEMTVNVGRIPEKSGSIVTMMDGELIVFTNKYVRRMKWSDGRLEVESTERMKESSYWPRACPIVVENEIFVLCEKQCLCVQMEGSGPRKWIVMDS